MRELPPNFLDSSTVALTKISFLRIVTKPHKNTPVLVGTVLNKATTASGHPRAGSLGILKIAGLSLLLLFLSASHLHVQILRRQFFFFSCSHYSCLNVLCSLWYEEHVGSKVKIFPPCLRKLSGPWEREWILGQQCLRPAAALSIATNRSTSPHVSLAV